MQKGNRCKEKLQQVNINWLFKQEEKKIKFHLFYFDSYICAVSRARQTVVQTTVKRWTTRRNSRTFVSHYGVCTRERIRQSTRRVHSAGYWYVCVLCFRSNTLKIKVFSRDICVLFIDDDLSFIYWYSKATLLGQWVLLWLVFMNVQAGTHSLLLFLIYK